MLKTPSQNTDQFVHCWSCRQIHHTAQASTFRYIFWKTICTCTESVIQIDRSYSTITIYCNTFDTKVGLPIWSNLLWLRIQILLHVTDPFPLPPPSKVTTLQNILWNWKTYFVETFEIGLKEKIDKWEP